MYVFKNMYDYAIVPLQTLQLFARVIKCTRSVDVCIPAIASATTSLPIRA
jgi:hypothetical protein